MTIQLILNTPEDGARFNQLCGYVPAGSFYASNGTVIPYRNHPTSFNLQTSYPNTRFLILVNGIQSNFVTTDGLGSAPVGVQLPLGDCNIEIQREFSTEISRISLTTREYANWTGAIAEQVTNIDTSITNTLNSFYLAKAGPTDINLAHGVPLLTPNDMSADIEAYRESLQIMRQTLRQYTGTLSGKYGATAAISRIDPLVWERNKVGKKWVLGYDLLENNIQRSSRVPLNNLTLMPLFVQLLSVDTYVNTFTGVFGTLRYNPYYHKFVWLPPGFTIPIIVFPHLIDSELISGSGKYTIKSGRAIPYLQTQSILSNGTWIAGSLDHFYFELDDRGIIDAWAQRSNPNNDYRQIMTAAIMSNESYNRARRVNTQCSGALANLIEVYNISDVPYAPIITSWVGTISTDAANNLSYAEPLDVAGPWVAATAGAKLRLYSNNGSYVDVYVNEQGIIPPSTNDSFIAGRRYLNAVSINATSGSYSKYRATSQNYRLNSGISQATVHDGPINLGAFDISTNNDGIFGTPSIRTSIMSVITAGATSISVPSGSALKFSNNNNNIYTPFDAIVGYGLKSTAAGTYTLTAIDEATATVQTSISFFAVGDTHLVITAAFLSSAVSYLNGAHKIVQLIDDKNVVITYNGVYVSECISGGLLTTFVKPIGIDKKSPRGVGTIYYSAIFNSLSFQGVGEAIPGTSRPYASGHVRLFSAAGIYIDLLVYSPGLVGNISDNVIVSGFANIVDSTNNLTKWSSGEKVTVISVTPGSPNETWNLSPTSPIVGNYETTQIVYSPQDSLPYNINSFDSYGDLTVNVNMPNEPAAFTTESITTMGSSLPDGWTYTGAGTPSFILYPSLVFDKGMFIVTDLVNPVPLEITAPFNEDLRGWKITFDAWIRNNNVLPTELGTFKLSFDFGAGWIDSSNITLNSCNDTRYHPQLMQFSAVVPPDATQIRLRIYRYTTPVPVTFIITRVALIKYKSYGLFLGDGTIPRSNNREMFGSLIYVWGPTPLTSAEDALIGTGVPADGRISDASNAHESLEVFDVSRVSGGNVLNVRGTDNNSTWTAATLTNMSVTQRVPERFTFAAPTLPSMIYGETLSFTSFPPYDAVLTKTSTSNLAITILYEDGIPVPQDTWQYLNATTIRVLSGFNPAAIYTIDYEILIRAESAAIDIQSPATPDNYWFADVMTWNRHTSEYVPYRDTVSLTFGADFTASLSRRSDQNKLASVLIEDTGISKRTIPTENWNYTDSTTVSIDGAEFNSSAIYSLEYNQLILNLQRQTNLVFEVRSASSVPGLALATYRAFNINDLVDGTLRYHQIRVTITNVIDIRDVRIHTMTLRGLEIDDTSSPPGM